MVAPPAEFPQFLRLPVELRDMIWELALPEPRVFEVLDSPYPAQSLSNPSSCLAFADIRNEPPPALSRSCRDARRAVLRRYKPLVFSGTMKHLDLSRDILLLDAHLQVKKLLKVARLLSQVEVVRSHITSLALGTSWGLTTGLHHRLFHRTVQTKRNLAKFMEHISKFSQLKTLTLVVCQRQQETDSKPNHSACPALPERHQNLSEPYFPKFNVNFNIENYQSRHPCKHYLWQAPYPSKLIKHNPEIEKMRSAGEASCGSKQCLDDPPRPQYHQVHALKETFKQWLKKLAEDGALGKSLPPQVDTATLTWIYTKTRKDNCCEHCIPWPVQMNLRQELSEVSLYDSFQDQGLPVYFTLAQYTTMGGSRPRDQLWKCR